LAAETRLSATGQRRHDLTNENRTCKIIIEQSFHNLYVRVMARPKTFDDDVALDAAIGVFREHGYEGTSAQMLVDAMGIGRQSLYNSFGDKAGLYRAAVRRYAVGETQAHRQALRTGDRAIDGLRAMVDRVIREARLPCLGVNSVAELGTSWPALNQIRAAADRSLRTAIVAQVEAAQADGDIAADLEPDTIATWFVASFAGIRIAARGGASAGHLTSLGELTLRALR
jgi:TetR/AcrR family transcriptional regulator, transcriptional repressor for nem operon